MLTKEKCTSKLVPLVFAATLLRIYYLIPCEKLHFSFKELRFLDSTRFFVFMGVAVVLSAVTAILISCFAEKAAKAQLLFAIAVADPLFFLVQENITTVIISTLLTACILLLLKTKNLLIDAVILGICIFISSTLIPETLYSTVPLLFVLVVIKYFGSFGDEGVKTVIFALICIISVAGSIFINNSFKKDMFLFNKFLNGKTSYTYNRPYLMVIFSVIILAISLIILFELISFARKKSKKKKNQLITETSVFLLCFAGVLIICLFALQLYALFSKQNNPSYMAMNIGAPLILLFTVTKHGNAFDSVFEEIGEHLKKNFKIYFPLFMAFCLIYLQVAVGYYTLASDNYYSARNILFYAKLYNT